MSKDDNVIRIAHISDLHFGADKPEEEIKIWNRLVNYFTQKLKPHFVLVTGDIVNTPDEELYRRSKRELNRLAGGNEKYRVCPGNHDRFYLGFGVGGDKYSYHHKLAPVFDQTFSGIVLTPGFPHIKTFSAPGNNWCCKFIGCDTADNTAKKYFAQGVVDGETIDALSQSALDRDEDEKKSDIVFFLLHHHLLRAILISGV
jgi:3',5'-cyclic AMP phosphodiesterase CpdA